MDAFPSSYSSPSPSPSSSAASSSSSSGDAVLLSSFCSSVLVAVSAPDPLRQNISPFPFFSVLSSLSLLSSSGTLYYSPQQHDPLILCCGDIIQPFLSSPASVASASSGFSLLSPPLIPYTRLSICLSPSVPPYPLPSSSPHSHPMDSNDFFDCELIRIGTIASVHSIYSHILRNNNEMDIGWCNSPPPPPVIHNYIDKEEKRQNEDIRHYLHYPFHHTVPPANSHYKHLMQANQMKRSGGLMAVLRIKQKQATQEKTELLAQLLSSLPPPLPFSRASLLHRGEPLTVISSPYGLLSPHLFHNSVTQGIVSNSLRPFLDTGDSSSFSFSSSPSPSPLYLTDARCLPGSEGGSILDASGHLIGIVALPLKHCHYSSPIQLNCFIHVGEAVGWLNETEETKVDVLKHYPSEAVSFYSSSSSVSSSSPPSLHKRPAHLKHQHVASSSKKRHAAFPHAFPPLYLPPRAGLSSSSAPFSSISSLISSCQRSILTVSYGSSWASSLVLSSSGYILTNAHLLKPHASSFFPHPTHPSLLLPSLRHTVSVRLLPFNCANYEEFSLSSFSSSSSPSPLSFAHFQWVEARVVYVSNGPFDIALLKIDTPFRLIPFPLPFPSLPSRPGPICSVGGPVYVIGAALFSPETSLPFTVTRGHLSKRLSLPLSPSCPPEDILLQCSAAVHNGNSGGALINGETGELMGMVTSNVAYTAVWPHPVFDKKGAAHAGEDTALPADSSPLSPPVSPHSSLPSYTDIIPHLNFSIPVNQLIPIFQFISSGGNDFSPLHALDLKDTSIGRIWQLEPLIPLKVPQLKLPRKYRELEEKLREQEREEQKQHTQTHFRSHL